MFDYMYFPVKKKKKLHILALSLPLRSSSSELSKRQSQQDIVLRQAPEGLIVKAMVFPVVMYRCEWTIKKAEHKVWVDHKEEPMLSNSVLAKTQRVPWTARRSNQPILKEIHLDYSLEELLLKLKLQYFGHLMQRAYSLEKTLMLEKIESKRRRG